MIPSLNNSSLPFADLDLLITTYELENEGQFMWFGKPAYGLVFKGYLEKSGSRMRNVKANG